MTTSETSTLTVEDRLASLETRIQEAEDAIGTLEEDNDRLREELQESITATQALLAQLMTEEDED